MEHRDKIAFDLDEVLCDFIGTFLFWYNRIYHTNWKLSKVLDYQWHSFLKIPEPAAVEAVHDFFKSQDFLEMLPIEGAFKIVREIAEDHALYLVTARQNAIKEETSSWISTYFPGLFKEVILTNGYPLDGLPTFDKGDVCKDRGCSIIIDDNPYHIESLSAHGVQTILLTRPWNATYSGNGVIRADKLSEIPDIVRKITRGWIK